MEAEEFEITDLAFPSLKRILFRTTEPGSGQIGGMTQTYRDVYEAMESISRMQFYRLFPDDMRRRPDADWYGSTRRRWEQSGPDTEGDGQEGLTLLR